MGGGIPGGQVIGRTDNDGAIVEVQPVTSADFMATVCEVLGIDSHKTNEGPGGRAVRLTAAGAKPIAELLPTRTS